MRGSPAWMRFTPGNAIELLRSGAEFFPALIDGDRRAREREVWLETYIFADDASGRAIADALVRAAQRGVDGARAGRRLGRAGTT